MNAAIAVARLDATDPVTVRRGQKGESFTIQPDERMNDPDGNSIRRYGLAGNGYWDKKNQCQLNIVED